jgi:hypothetical protein
MPCINIDRQPPNSCFLISKLDRILHACGKWATTHFHAVLHPYYINYKPIEKNYTKATHHKMPWLWLTPGFPLQPRSPLLLHGPGGSSASPADSRSTPENHIRRHSKIWRLILPSFLSSGNRLISRFPQPSL